MFVGGIQRLGGRQISRTNAWKREASLQRRFPRQRRAAWLSRPAQEAPLLEYPHLGYQALKAEKLEKVDQASIKELDSPGAQAYRIFEANLQDRREVETRLPSPQTLRNQRVAVLKALPEDHTQLETPLDDQDPGVLQWRHWYPQAKFTRIYEKMVPWELTQTLDEYHQTRKACSVFEHSERWVLEICGEHAFEVSEAFLTAPISRMGVNDGLPTLVLDSKAIILDLAEVIRTETSLLLIFRGFRKAHLYNYLVEYLNHVKSRGLDANLFEVNLEVLSIQGPTSISQFTQLLEDSGGELMSHEGSLAILRELPRHHSLVVRWQSALVRILRISLTGEEGVLLLGDSPILSKLLAHLPAAANNALEILRLEAGFLKMGVDIKPSYTPLRCGFSWMLDTHKLRRHIQLGWQQIFALQSHGVDKLQVTLTSDFQLREQAPIYTADRQMVGQITSACWSPHLKGYLASGFIALEFAKVNLEVQVSVLTPVNPETLPRKQLSYLKRAAYKRSIYRELVSAIIVQAPVYPHQ